MYMRKQTGVGLIEILVAVVIMAIGFLAAARMQVTGMRFSQGAYYESQAYFMAGEMIARMRANVAGVRSGAYDSMTTVASSQNPGCVTKLCTPAELAAQDQYDWSRHLYAADDASNFVPLLPSSAKVSAVGEIKKLSDGKYSVSITWADEHGTNNSSNMLRVDLVVES